METAFFRRMIEEKGLEEETFTLIDKEGHTHFIGVENVLEAIEQAPESEQVQIARKFRFIDIQNQDLLKFIKHLADALINN